MKKLMVRLTIPIAVLIGLTLIACDAGTGKPNPNSNPVPTGTVLTYDPNPVPTYAHKPVGMAVPNPNAAPGFEGNYYWVNLVTRVYDEHGDEMIGFNSPQVHFKLSVQTASGQPALAYDTFLHRSGYAPIEWDNYPPLNDEQHFQELAQATDGTWHGILAATWTLTVTLNPGWKMNCIVVDMGSQLTVSRSEISNPPTGVATRASTQCMWPYDPRLS